MVLSLNIIDIMTCRERKNARPIEDLSARIEHIFEKKRLSRVIIFKLIKFFPKDAEIGKCPVVPLLTESKCTARAIPERGHTL